MAALLVWIEREAWSAYRTDSLDEPALRMPAEERHDFGEAMSEAGLSGPVVVALESDLCLSARFEAASRRQSRNREQLAYQIEETLPVAAEEVVSDFYADGLSVLGVACDRALFERVLSALEGCDVRCVAPGAVLAAEAFAHERRDLPATLWRRPGGVEEVRYHGAGPVAWRTLPREASRLEAALAAQRLAGEGVVPDAVLGGREEEGGGGVGGAEEVEFVEVEGRDPCLGFAARGAERIARGESRAAIDLLRGAPETSVARRSPLRWEQRLVAVAALLVLLTATAWQAVRGAQLQERLEQLTTAEEDLFREVFPDKRLPRGVRTRLESELRRIAGARADLTDLPEHADSTLQLESLLGSLPTDLRFRLSEIRVEAERVALLGEARSHSDADRIAASIRRTGLVVTPPSTRQLAKKGVEFRLAAQPPQVTP